MDTMKTLICAVILVGSASPLFSQTTDSSAYFYQKGMEEKTAKRYLVASQNFDKAIRLNPKYTAAYIENGNVNLEMRRTDAARLNFTKANDLEPGNPVVMGALVNLYYDYRQYQAALEMAQKCATCSNAARIIALSYFHLDDYGKSEKLLKQVPKYQEDAEIQYALGRTYMEMELTTKAIPYYEKALKLDETKGTWAFELGLLYYTAEKYKDAVISFNNATAHGYPKSNEFNENLGYAYLYSGEYDKGEQMLLDVHSRIRGNKDIYRDLAEVYYNRKLYDKSLEYCQKIMEIDIKDGKALYQAGLCFQKKGEKERGQQMCDKAIELDPSLRGLRIKKQISGL